MERGSREHLAKEALGGSKKPELKPETAALKKKLDQASTGDKARIHSKGEQLRRDIAVAQVEDQMRSLVRARQPEIEALGWSSAEGDERKDQAIPPPPLPEFQPRPHQRRKSVYKEPRVDDDQIAA